MAVLELELNAEINDEEALVDEEALLAQEMV